mgnify:CR=1 FL=1
MTKPLFWSLLISPLVLINGCKQKENKELSSVSINTAVKKYTMNVDLGFESCNYYGKDSGFILMDFSGNYIKPIVDTVTKGGGHIDYDSLPAGIYNYRIRTVFNEYKDGKIVLDKNFYESVGPTDVYVNTDSITEKILVEADSIKVVFAETYYGPFHVFSFVKEENRYKAEYYIFDTGYDGYKQNTKRTFTKDSAAVIEMLIKFHSVVNGIISMGITEDPNGLPSHEFTEAYYIKADNTFYYSWDLQNNYFKEGYKQFKNSFFSSR